MPVITISRMFGSGGSEVAARVADGLGWTLLDNALVDRVAGRREAAGRDVGGAGVVDGVVPQDPVAGREGDFWLGDAGPCAELGGVAGTGPDDPPLVCELVGFDPLPDGEGV